MKHAILIQCFDCGVLQTLLLLRVLDIYVPPMSTCIVRPFRSQRLQTRRPGRVHSARHVDAHARGIIVATLDCLMRANWCNQRALCHRWRAIARRTAFLNVAKASASLFAMPSAMMDALSQARIRGRKVPVLISLSSPSEHLNILIDSTRPAAGHSRLHHHAPFPCLHSLLQLLQRRSLVPITTTILERQN